MIDTIKAYASAIICASAGLVLLVLALWIHGLHGDITTLKIENGKLVTKMAQEKSLREQAAREYTSRLAQVERDHAASQQLKEDRYAKEKQALSEQRDAERTAAVRLRDRLSAATARRGQASSSDSAAGERDARRLEDLGRLAGEGVGLVAEARAILRDRDAKVKRLQDQVGLDRQACEAH